PNSKCSWCTYKSPPVLKYAVSVQNEDVVAALLEANNIDINGYGDCLVSPLLDAVIKDNRIIVELLLHNAASPDMQSGGYDRTPLVEAAMNDCKEICRLLLQYGASHDAIDNKGMHSIYLAAQNNHREVIELLMQYGADPQQPSVQSKGSFSAARHARNKGHVELSNWLTTQR
ncbi:unnamed protein product, partial [Meganyctiphanes norvegica]